jgi:hypothetical protein
VKLIAAATSLVAAALAVTGAAPAAAAAEPVVRAVQATNEPGAQPLCTVDDPRAVELSGLVATADGYVSVVDSQFDTSKTVIVYLDKQCRVSHTQKYPTSARDPEDLAVAPDGTLWVADTGDNNKNRQTIALWRIPPGGGSPVIHRLTYPDGAHDAEALLFAGDGTPVVITKELGPASFLYAASAPLQPNTAAGVPLRKVGEFRPTAKGDPNSLGVIGELLVTGAAMSPDRSRVALRTYAAAYEWDVPDGDVIKAITTGTPRYTPLPDEPQGESIAYTVDGQQFLTLSDESGPTVLRQYPRSTSTLTATTASAGPIAVVEQQADGGPMLWYGMALAGGGAVILVAGLVWLVARRIRRA